HLTAGSILLCWCLAKRLRPTGPQIRASIIIGTFFFLISHGMLHWAEQKVPSGLASLLIASEPICVFLLSAAASQQWHWNSTLLAGILLGLGGVGLLMGRSALTSVPGLFVSSLAVVISAVSWSAGVVYSRRSHLSGHPLLLSALSLLAGSAQLLLVGTVVGVYRGFSLASVALRSCSAGCGPARPLRSTCSPQPQWSPLPLCLWTEVSPGCCSACKPRPSIVTPPMTQYRWPIPSGAIAESAK